MVAKHVLLANSQQLSSSVGVQLGDRASASGFIGIWTSARHEIGA